MTDLLTRFLLVGLGVAMIVISVVWFMARAVARWFAPQVVVVESSSEARPFPMTRALLLIVAAMLLLALFGHPASR